LTIGKTARDPSENLNMQARTASGYFTNGGREMLIQVDSREKSRAIEKIICEFQRQDIKYFISKLYIGDYCNPENPLLLIDRKQNIAEIAQNAISGHARFKNELQRLDEVSGKM
jgi:hypothetical protein